MVTNSYPRFIKGRKVFTALVIDTKIHSLGSSANKDHSKAWTVMSSQRRITVIYGSLHSTVLVLRCTQFARIEIHGGKHVGQGNSRVKKGLV